MNNKQVARELLRIAKELIAVSDPYDTKEGHVRGIKKWLEDAKKYNIHKTMPDVYADMMKSIKKSMARFKINPKEIGL